MCRMIAVHARGKGVYTASKLVLLLAEAAAHDPYLEEVAGDPRHCHGYGYVLATSSRGAWKLTYERYDAHPYTSHEESCEANLKALDKAAHRLSETLRDAEEAILILHARRAGRGEPRGHTAAHPFREETILTYNHKPQLAEVYLAHNGSVRKEKIAEKLGLAGQASTYTDSHLVLKLLVKMIKNTRIEELNTSLKQTISKTKPHTKSALNLLILAATPGIKPTLYAYGHLVSGDPTRQQYYKPIIIEGDGYKAYVSSTIHDLALEQEIEIHRQKTILDKLEKIATI